MMEMTQSRAGKILIVEDDLAIAKGLEHNLSYEGYTLRCASHGNAALPIFQDFKPDLVILDLMLPGRSGFEILEALRLLDSKIYIVILSAKTSENEKIQGLNAGADDYIAKPFQLREFLARINARMRRIAAERDKAKDCLYFDQFEVNPAARSLSRNGEILKLSPKAIDLLIFFVQNPNQNFSRAQLLNKVWTDDYEGTERTIDNFVLQIRNHIEEVPNKPQRLETVYGLGYRFNIREDT